MRPATARLASAFVLSLLALGTVTLWVGIPPLVIWGLSKLIESRTLHYGVGLVAVPTAMVLFALGLSWLNDLYLRIQMATAKNPVAHWSGERDRPVSGGPLEPLLLLSLALAIVAAGIWFFVFAENPLLW